MKKKVAVVAMVAAALALFGCGRKNTQQVQVPQAVQRQAPLRIPAQVQQAQPAPAAVATPVPTPTPTPTPAERQVVLVPGLLQDYLAAGNDFGIYKESIGQKIVQGVSWREHPLQVGVLMERVHGYLQIKADGQYEWQFVTGRAASDMYVSLVMDGTAYAPSTTWGSDKHAVTMPLSAGMHQFSVFLGMRGNGRAHGPWTLQTDFALQGMPLRVFANGSYPQTYALYYDKSSLRDRSEAVQKVYKIEATPAPGKKVPAKKGK